MAEIESYAPMMAYLVRSMQSGSDLAKMMWQRRLTTPRNTWKGAERLLKPAAIRVPGQSTSAYRAAAVLPVSANARQPNRSARRPARLRQEMVLPALEI
jgi:hypothetical protein